MLGFVVSMLMRLELSQAGDVILAGNYQLYNVLITSHAFLMIFFFVMPIAISFNGGRDLTEIEFSSNILKTSLLLDVSILGAASKTESSFLVFPIF